MRRSYYYKQRRKLEFQRTHPVCTEHALSEMLYVPYDTREDMGRYFMEGHMTVFHPIRYDTIQV